ncbi:hypothetical protein [Nitrospira sp. BLG_2]|uniref:hypothetical protein n=1 Tax=Nitrospira sp. BLG_2 TaxID=3397507 RepID=UPI003B9DB59A
MPLIQAPLNKLSKLPVNSKIVDDEGKMSIERERYDNEIFKAVNSLYNRGFSSFIYNPDFNLLGASGYTPITQADGSDVETVSNWYVVNGGGATTYTIVPTPYPFANKSPSGSLNFLNVKVATLDSALYLYNLNYSTGVQQFNGATKYNGQLLTFSVAYRNNTLEATELSISASIPNIGLVETAPLYLYPGKFFVANQLKIPDMGDVDLGANPVVQFRLNINNLFGTPADFDLFYVKGEIGSSPTILQFDHILEQLRCQNLT